MLPTDKLQHVFEQKPFAVYQRAGPPRKTLSMLKRRGDWVVEMMLDVGGGSNALYIDVVNPETLLVQADVPRPAPATGEPPTTMVVTAGSGERLAVGKNHSVAGGAARIDITVLAGKRIGNGFVERADIVAPGLHLRVETAKANKFAQLDKQVAALHLDVRFLQFDRKRAAGALPEMWGLRSMSKETERLLFKPKSEAAKDWFISAEEHLLSDELLALEGEPSSVVTALDGKTALAAE